MSAAWADGGGDGVLVLRNASLAPGTTTDLAVREGTLVDAVALAGSGVPVERGVDLEGRPAVPGLADHHVHLFALAAAEDSVDLSPEALARAGGLVPALRTARAVRPSGWLRGVGYDVSTSGDLDREVLDRVAVGPVRVQDRTGIRWILDSTALDEVLGREIAVDDLPDGVEMRDGRPTGVLTRLDRWLRERVHPTEPDLGALGARLASYGLTSVTDAGADNDEDAVAALAAASLPLRVTAMTRDVVMLPEASTGSVAVGAVKILLDDIAHTDGAGLPPLDDLTAAVAEAHAQGRHVAVHCVSAASLVLALSAGLGPGDRIEHATEVPRTLDELLVASGVTVVVQPALVSTRGDRYRRDHPVDEHPALHRLGTLRDAGVPLAAGSDAPYGDPDPWLSIATAVERRTAGGQIFGEAERVTPFDALGLHLGTAEHPTVPRRLVPGEPADLVVLDDDWSAITDIGIARRPRILLTMLAGRLTHGTLPDV